MEFYKNAIKIRKQVTEWMLRDYGTKRNKRSVKQVLKNISPDDQKIIDSIFKKYGTNPDKEYQSEYPEWFVNNVHNTIITILHNLVNNIIEANTIYATHDFEFDIRRKYQDEAIANCYQLYQELQYVTDTFYTDLNKCIPLLESIEREIDLLKGWRTSDNKARKRLEDKNSKKK